MKIFPMALAAILAVSTTVGMATSATAQSAAKTEQGQIAYGGQLYDYWYKITTGDVPKGTHPSMPESGSKGKKSWRCIECHGYDFQGANGIKGVLGAAGKDPAAITAILKDDTHKYTDGMFTAADFNALSLFISKGVSDLSANVKDGQVSGGDAAKGAAVFETVCSVCHGADGKKITDMPPLGQVVNQLPLRSMHRIRYSTPGAAMPALSLFPIEMTLDILAYTKTLPQ